MPKIAAAAQSPDLLAKLPGLPAVVASQMVSLACKIIEVVSNLFWPKLPYRPTPQEKAIAGKVDLLKMGCLNPSPPTLFCHRIVPFARPVPTIVASPAADLRFLINDLVKKELDKVRGAVKDDRNKQALDVIAPIVTGLGGMMAKKQAALMQNIVLAPNPSPLSPPVQGLCEIGKQMAQVAFEEAKQSPGAPQPEFLNRLMKLIDPHVMPLVGVMIGKLGEVLDQINYPSLFDDSLAAVMAETSLQAEVKNAVLVERQLIVESQALQKVKKDDPRVKEYVEKLTKGEISFRRLSAEEQSQLKEAQVAKIKKEYPELSPKQVADWAQTNIQVECYLRVFQTERFTQSPFCEKEVKQIFQAREQVDKAGKLLIIKEAEQQKLVKREIIKIADSLVLRLFPVLEKEFRSSILPTILGLHFTSEEAKVVMDRAQNAIPRLWDLYLKEKVVNGVADLLELLVSPTYWDELLAADLLPFIQDKLLKQQFKMTIEADMNTFRPLLKAYDFGNGEDKSKAFKEIKEKLCERVTMIPLGEARVHQNVEELLKTLYQEQFLLRKQLESCLHKPQGTRYIKLIKEMASPQDKAVKINKNGKLLRSWELLVVGEKSEDKKAEIKFDRYAQPLIEMLATRFPQKKIGMVDTQVFQDVLDDVPSNPDPRYGQWIFGFIKRYHEHYAPDTKQPLEKSDLEKPLQKKVSDTFTSVLEPFRHCTIDQIIALLLTKLGKEGKDPHKVPLDREKIKKLLFVPNEPPKNLPALLSKEIETTATLTFQLLVNQVAPRFAPDRWKWIPYIDALAQKEVKKMLTGQDPSHIRNFVTDLLKETFGNPYVNLNRLRKVADRLNPQIEKAVAHINDGVRKGIQPVTARQIAVVK